MKQVYRSAKTGGLLTLQAGTGDINLSKVAQSLSVLLSMETADGTCIGLGIGVVLGWPTQAAGATVDTGIPATITAPLILPH